MVITRERARSVLENIAAALCQSVLERDVFLSPDIVMDSKILLDDGKTVPSPYKVYFLGFIDEAPKANWSHSCKYVFMNVDDGASHIVSGSWPPDVRYNLEKIL